MSETLPPIDESSEPPARERRAPLAYLPLVIFVAVVALLLGRLFAGDPSRLPSALIDKSAPVFDLPSLLAGQPGLSDKDLRQGHVTVLNIFASWCGPCHEENPQLVALAHDKRLAEEGIKLVGIAYKDLPEDARRYLGQEGNPYAAVGVDASGRTGIDFGVYGVPETYIIKGDGKIAFKFVGPIDDATLRDAIWPQIEAARK
ncbi:MAG: DsbE family thiol:disulfide interchange protein [Methylovirgula sp.]|nr:DsbE family thiol:disulfide interchange protein [Methylovirgula sp.]